MTAGLQQVAPMSDDLDLFLIYRRLLMIFVAAYSAVKLASLIGRGVRFLRSRRTKARLLRGYLLAQLAEMQPLRFIPDALQIAALAAALLVVLYLHGKVVADGY
jgi:hypothetical protein